MKPKLFHILSFALILSGIFCGRLNAAEGQTNINSQPSTPDLHSVSTNFVAEHFNLISRRGFADLEKRAAKGDVKAQYEVGARYAQGEGVDENSIKAYKWLEKAARQGDARAERRVGEMLLTGTGTAANAEAGLMWLQKAAAGGDALAQLNLGEDYVEGKIVAQNNTKAFQWLLTAAQSGIPVAERRIGVMYFRGQGTITNLGAGIEWWKKAAAQNEPEALYNLGVAYFHGNGEPKDPKLAFNYFLKSAIYGDNNKRIETDAKAILGVFFATGAGAPKDLDLGLRLFKSAAKDGNVGAQENLGKFFWTRHNYREAFRWLNKAAQQGSETAQYLLGGMYLEGLSVPTNYVEALKWFYLGAMQGDPDAQGMTQKMLARLNPAIGKQAKEQAEAFKPITEHPLPVDDSEVTICSLSPRFLIPVEIFGVTKHLLVDTGSPGIGLDNKFLARLGTSIGNISSGVAFGTNINTTIYRSPNISIGNRQLDNLWIMCFDLGKLSQIIGEPCDGLLGMSFLKDCLICFDPGKRTIRIGGLVPDWIKRDAQAIPLKLEPSQINSFSIGARVNGMATVHLLVDSGSAGTDVSLCEQDWRQIFRERMTNNLPATNTITLGNQVQMAKIIKLRSVIIGGNSYSNLTAQLIPGAKESSLGQDFIRKYVPAMDFPHQVLYLRPDHSTKTP